MASCSPPFSSFSGSSFLTYSLCCCYLPPYPFNSGLIITQRHSVTAVKHSRRFSRYDLTRCFLQVARRNASMLCRFANEDLKSNEERDLHQSAESMSEVLYEDEEWQWRKTARELVAYELLLVAVPLGTLLPKLRYSGAFYFVFLSVWSVYVGSHRSLQSSPPQQLSFKAGLSVPVICSISLFGFYCLLRFYPDLDLRTFISIYLGFAGTLAVASNLVGPVRYILPETNSISWRIDFPKWLIQDGERPVHFTLTAADCIALLVGIFAAIASRLNGAPFTLNNFVAVCIVTELLHLLSLGSFATAAVMLCGLLAYDVFWVFGSPHFFGDNVMVTVATSTVFEGPMKLIFPHVKENAANMYSILGLGDVAAPGLLIALMLRFDRARSRRFGINQSLCGLSEVPEMQKPDKIYFTTCIAAYLIGLIITIIVNDVSGTAQPALLYLVPSLLFGVIVMATYRSEQALLLNFKEEMKARKD